MPLSLVLGLWEFVDSILESRKRLRGWQDAVESRGLQVVGSSSFVPWRLKLAARAGPVEVRIEDLRSRRYAIQVVVVVPVPPDVSEVKIHRQSRHPLPWVREIEVGDETFDSTFYVSGPMRLVSALLDTEARRLLVKLNSMSLLNIDGGQLQAEMYNKRLHYVLPLLLDLGRRFSQPRDITRRLAKNARQDPAPGVRLQNLLLLVRESPGDPRTAKALHRACWDASPKIRLWAARELGDEGRGALMQLAGSMADDDCSAQAVSALGPELPFKRARAFLAQALRRRHLQTARACLEVLGRSGNAAAVDELSKVMAREKGELAAAAAQALGTTGSAAAEPPLIQALERDKPDLRVAAARSLGLVGSASAVLPLEEVAERFSHDREFGRAVQQAIAEIQSRLPGASPGQLSLAGTETGQLALAGAEAGQLSLAEAEAGQLSLASDPGGQLSLSGEEQRREPRSRN